MAVRWTLSFKSYLGTDYTVSIYDSSFSGTASELTGAAQPFETEEDNNDEPLTPVRYSTGYIRIINTGQADEDEIAPTTPKDRFVTLSDGTSTLWQGYIKCESFSQPWDSEPYELEFPVISALGMLDGVQAQKGDFETRDRVARYFRLALDNLDATYQRIYYPLVLAEDSTQQCDLFFRLGLLDRNWFTYKNENVLDKTESRYDGMTYMEIISAICEAFGLTLYERGMYLYLTVPYSASYGYITFSALSTLASNGTATITSASVGSQALTSLTIASNNNKVDVVTAARRGVIEAAISEIDEDSMPRVNSQFLDYIQVVYLQKESDDTAGYYYFEENLGLYEPVSGSDVWTFLCYQNGSEVTWDSQYLSQDYHMGAFVRNYSNEDCLIIIKNTLTSGVGYGGTYTIALKSTTETFFAGGYIKLSGTIESYEGTGAATSHYGYFGVRCGSYYYDSTNHEWTTTESYFQVLIDDDSHKIYTNTSPESGYSNDDEGYYMPLPENGIYGDLELFVYDPVATTIPSGGVEGLYLFKDITVEYVGPAEDIFNDYPVTDTNRFVETFNAYAEEDAQKNLMLTSYINNRMGYGVIINADYSAPLTSVYDVNLGDCYFEESLMRAIMYAHREPQKLITLDARQSSQLPVLCDYSYGGDGYFYIASTTKWRDDLHELKVCKRYVEATYTVSGVVSDGTNPITGANVYFNDENYLTGLDGAFTFSNVLEGTYTLTAECDGYVSYSASVTVSGNTTANIEMTPDYLCFTAVESGTFQLSTNAVSYSIDGGETWTTLAAATASPTVSAGNKILWKGSITPTTSAGCGTFSSTGQFNASGNPLSLVLGDSFVGVTTLPYTYCFCMLFKNCTKLIDASELQLVATTLKTSCYKQMFYSCTAMTAAPQLPAMTMVNSCYMEIFRLCRSLTSIELPATTLAAYCYQNALRSTGITSIELPATTLVGGCYTYMCVYCSSLSYVKAMFTSTPTQSNTNYWMDSVASSGTFVKNSAATWDVTGTSDNHYIGVPPGWTVETADS